MSLAGELSHSEIQRLKGLGFDDWRIDENGVRIFPSKKAEYISFPKIAYENTHLSRDDFWSRHRVEILNQELDKHKVDLIWELGGGDGRMSIPLWERGKGVIAIEPHYEGCLKVAEAGIPIFEGTLKDLAIPHNSLHAVGFFDVLEHIENEKEFLKNVYEKMEVSGLVFLSVPAHSWLFAEHDVALGHYRRYSRKSLRRVFEDVGFEVVSCEFIFTFLVVPAFLIRRLPFLMGQRRDTKIVLAEAESILNLPRPLVHILGALCRVERLIKLPFGLSLFAVLRKA